VSSTKYLVFIDRRRSALAVPLVLLLLLAIFPPETRGDSMVACSALVALHVLLSWREVTAVSGRSLVLVAAALALPAAMTAGSPAAAVLQLAIIFTAASAGMAALRFRGEVRATSAAAGVLALSGGLAGIHALYQKLWGLERLADWVAANPATPDYAILLGRIERGRAFAGFATPAGLGCFLAIALPATLGLAFAARGRKRYLWIVFSVLQAAGFFCAASATALAALLGAMFLALLLWRSGRRAAWIGLIVAMLVLVGLVALRGEEIISSGHRNSPWRLRAGNFMAAWSMAQEHPLRGVGPGGFAENYSLYRRPGDNETRHVHNLPLEMAAENGWIGGLLISALFFYIFLRPLLRRRAEDPPAASGIAIGLAAFALHNLADYTAFMPSLLWMTAILCGLTWTNEKREASDAGSEARRIVRAAGLAVAVLAALIAGVSGVARDYRISARAAAFAGQHAYAKSLASNSVDLAPWDGDAALLLARTMLDDPPLPDAQEDRKRLASLLGDQAVRVAPRRAAARELRATIRSALGDYAGAYADFSEAAKLYPMEIEYAESRDSLGRLIREATRVPGEGR
jgi:O-antigen ligase